ncbi:MAG: rhomboid family intramembrane serine protease, partial [Verrucomicrobia bacterium]|nr:rhomboid family intramembrane serine protease [Verrucomicrobiota bacterium]
MASLKSSLSASGQIASDFEAPEGLVPVGLYADFSSAGEAGLAILAMGKAYWTLQYHSDYIICVRSEDAAAVREELRAVAELAARPRRLGATRFREFSFGYRSFFLYAALLVGCFVWQQSGPALEAGRGDAIAMMEDGQWARAVTALMLHGDVVHLVSNLVAGMGFAFCVARFFGAASAWLLILLCGALGNALNAWVYYPEAHYSIGASTAVFAALGLLTGAGVWIALREARQSWSMPPWFIPIFGGVTLLGLVGIGDGSLNGIVDVAAHISGFFCGLLIGLLGAIFQPVFVAWERHRA